MEDDTMEGGAGMQSATATPSRTPTVVHGAAWPGRVPHALPSPVPDALVWEYNSAQSIVGPT